MTEQRREYQGRLLFLRKMQTDFSNQSVEGRVHRTAAKAGEAGTHCHTAPSLSLSSLLYCPLSCLSQHLQHLQSRAASCFQRTVYLYSTATLWLLTVPLWYAKLNKAAEKNSCIYTLALKSKVLLEVKISVTLFYGSPCIIRLIYFPEIYTLWDFFQKYNL